MSTKDIRFRGKTPMDNWVYGDLLKLGDNYYIVPEYIEDEDEVAHSLQLVNKETVGQSVQLYDSEGNEVFEDDIIQDQDETNITVVGVLNIYAHWHFHRMSRQKVVGNIHDNPDMDTI